MTIRLVDATEDEQKAFDRTPPDFSSPPGKHETTNKPDQSQTTNKTEQPKQSSDAKVTASSDDAAQSVSAAMTELSGKLTPDLIANPINKLIDALKPPVQTAANRSPDFVPNVGLVEPKSHGSTVPSVGQIETRTRPIDGAASGLNQILDRMQRRLGTSMPGRQANKMITMGRGLASRRHGSPGTFAGGQGTADPDQGRARRNAVRAGWPQQA